MLLKKKSLFWHIVVAVQLLSRVWLFVTPWTVDHQASLYMGFPRQEYWSGWPFPSPGFSSLQFSHSVTSDSLWPHTRPPCPSPTPRVHSNSRPLSRWCHPAISSSVAPSPPAPNPSQHQSLFQWVSSSHDVAKVLEFQLQHHYIQRNPRVDLLENGLVGYPCSPRDSRESSSTPQFKSINSSVLSFRHIEILNSMCC